MRTKYSDSPLWHLLPPEQPPAISLRRSNLTVIAILAFFTFGLLVAGFVEAGKLAFEAGKAPPNNVSAFQSAHHATKAASERQARTN